MTGRSSNRSKLRPPRRCTKPLATAGRFLSFLPAIVIAEAHITAAIWVLIAAASDVRYVSIRTTAAVVLAGLGCWLTASLLRAWRLGFAPYPSSTRVYVRCVLIGVIVSYATALLLDARDSAAYIFWLGVAIWHAGVYGALTWQRSRGQSAGLLSLFSARTQTVARCCFAVIMLVPAAEFSLRLYALAIDDHVHARYVANQLRLDASQHLGRQVNSAGYWDDEFSTDVVPGLLRIAAVGDEMLLNDGATRNVLDRLDGQLPAAEVLNFAVPQASPSTSAGRVSFASHRQGHSDAAWERALRQMKVCVTSEDETIEAKWSSLLSDMDRIVSLCRKLRIKPTLVALPCEFQVDDTLRETLRRRGGYHRALIDADRPQRRLSAYAKDRGVEWIDLLPHLRGHNAPTFAYNTQTLNDAGNAVVADVLAAHLGNAPAGSMLAAK